MHVDLEAQAQQLRTLRDALLAFADDAAFLGLRPPAELSWFEVLQHKLLPQLTGEPWLVVAVVGGTNIGKSAIFNHLAGEHASAVSPLAARTRHPVCLVPPQFADRDRLARLFEGFDLLAWRSADDPLHDTPHDRLYYRVGQQVPSRLLLLDTPDIDSDAQVNWRRAEHIRQTADVLIAVLTQQKYNDAAVKQFFRKAAAAGQEVIVVFNQCDLEHDRPYWPQWLETFVTQTGVQPQLVYVVPLDRQAASQLRLPFLRVGPDGRSQPATASDLRDELARLHFDDIKLRTLRGALAELLDPATGLPAYLNEVRAASDEFRQAQDILSAEALLRVPWPPIPFRVLRDEIVAWWDARRSAWSRAVHRAYRLPLRWMRRAYQALRQRSASPALADDDPLERFVQDESAAVAGALSALLEQLDRLAHISSQVLRPRLYRLLTGATRQQLIHDTQAAHRRLPPVDEDFRRFLWQRLDGWAAQYPRAVGALRLLDQTAAVARPLITVGLFFTGTHLAADVAANVAVDAAITGGIVGGGEAVVAGAGAGARHALAQLFRDVQSQYVQHRVDWLVQQLQGWLQPLSDDLRRGADVGKSEAFRSIQQACQQLETMAAPRSAP